MKNDSPQAQPAPELKPCPFCAKQPEVMRGDGALKPMCRIICRSFNECAVLPSTSWYRTETEAVTAWNTRALPRAAADDDDYELAYKIVEEMGLGFKVRNCSCGQLPCLRLRPIADALAKREAEVRAATPRATEGLKVEGAWAIAKSIVHSWLMEKGVALTGTNGEVSKSSVHRFKLDLEQRIVTAMMKSRAEREGERT
jgi:hypothetical protein